MLGYRCICKEDTDSRAKVIFKSQQNQIHFCYTHNSKKNIFQFIKHLLRAFYVQGSVPFHFFTLASECNG
jgi:hypothetical protein